MEITKEQIIENPMLFVSILKESCMPNIARRNKPSDIESLSLHFRMLRECVLAIRSFINCGKPRPDRNTIPIVPIELDPLGFGIADEQDHIQLINSLKMTRSNLHKVELQISHSDLWHFYISDIDIIIKQLNSLISTIELLYDCCYSSLTTPDGE